MDKNNSQEEAAIEMKNLENSLPNADLLSEYRSELGDQLDNATRLEIKTLKHDFYKPIFLMLFAFTTVGVPFNFCFDDAHTYLPDSTDHFTILLPLRILSSKPFKLYTILFSIIHHLILTMALILLGNELLVKTTFDQDTAFYFLVFFGILSGVIAIDMVWCNRRALGRFLRDLFDYWKFLEERPHYRKLFVENVGSLSRYRIKFALISIFSGLLFVSLIFLLIFLVVISLLDSPPVVPAILPALRHLLKAKTNDTDDYHYGIESRLIGLVSYYSIFFFLSKAFVLLVFVWVLQFEIEHLNLFIKNLTTNLFEPDIGAIEIIKNWYRDFLNKVRSLDQFARFYTAVYFSLLFYGIVYCLDRLMELFKLVGGVKTVSFCTYCALLTVCFIFLMYGLKQFALVHEKSSRTKTILFDFVLNTKPEQRAANYCTEFEFVIQGLLSRPAVFTILGQIELTRSFMVHLGLVIYTYAIIFHKLVHPAPSSAHSR